MEENRITGGASGALASRSTRGADVDVTTDAMPRWGQA